MKPTMPTDTIAAVYQLTSLYTINPTNRKTNVELKNPIKGIRMNIYKSVLRIKMNPLFMETDEVIYFSSFSFFVLARSNCQIDKRIRQLPNSIGNERDEFNG